MPELAVPKGSVDYDVHGPSGAPWVLVLPGAATARWMYEPLRDALAPDFRVLTLDYRGIGRSRNDLWHVGPETLAEDALALLRHVGAEEAHVVGFSLGTFVLAEMLHRDPARVARCAAGALPALRGRWHLPADAQTLLAEDPDALETVEALKQALIPLFFAKGFREGQPERFAAMMKRIGEQSAWELFAGLQQFWGGFGWDWRRLRVYDTVPRERRLFLTGEEDFLARLADARDHPLLRGGPTLLVRGGGHVFFYEQPGPTNQVLGAFLREGRLPSPLPRGVAPLLEAAA